MLKSFRDFSMTFVNEKKGDMYQYGCAMVYFDFPQAVEIHEMIDPEDLYTESEDRTFGIEDEPHATLLYGLHSNEVSDEEVMQVSTSIPIGRITLKNASLFKNAKAGYEVLKFDIENDAMYDINQKLSALPHTTDFPDYHPHCTIAYLKPGKGAKYVDLLNGATYDVAATSIVYSKPDGSRLKESCV